MLQVSVAGILWGTGGLAVQFIRHVTPMAPLTISVVTFLEPVTAAVAAAVFLGERIGPAAVLGTIMILAAVAGLERDVPAPSAVPGPTGGAVAESSPAGRPGLTVSRYRAGGSSCP